MKKILSFLFIATLFLQTVLAVPLKTEAAGPPDQQCDASLSTGWNNIASYAEGVWQTFTPVNINYISKIVLDMEFDDAGDIGMVLMHGDDPTTKTGDDILAFGFATVNPGRQNVEFVFTEDKLVTKGDSGYKIVAVAGSASIPKWYYESDCYNGGARYLNGDNFGGDFGFAIYGFDSETSQDVPGEDEPVVVGGNNDSGTTENTTSDTSSSVLEENLAVIGEDASTASSSVKTSESETVADASDDQSGVSKFSALASGSSAYSTIINIAGGALALILAGLLYWLRRKDKKKVKGQVEKKEQKSDPAVN